MMRTLIISLVEGTANLKREIGMFLKGVVATGDLVVPSVVAFAMERMQKRSVLGGYSTFAVAVALDMEPGTEVEKDVGAEKQLGENGAADATKENPVGEPEEKEPEEKEMTVEEYEKVLEEKRKALAALKTERKVDLDKELKSMQQLSSKKTNDEIFIKLGSERDISKEAAEKEERANKSVSINEFLKPAEGENQMFYGDRNRSGGGCGSRGGHSGGEHGGYLSKVQAPSITDPGHFPSLGGK